MPEEEAYPFGVGIFVVQETSSLYGSPTSLELGDNSQPIGQMSGLRQQSNKNMDPFISPAFPSEMQMSHKSIDTLPAPANKICYKCRERGHYINKCPQRRPDQTSAQNTASTPNGDGHSAPIITGQNYVRARVNHAAIDEAQTALDVVLGEILVNDTQAVVLFDPKTSHSFVSTDYVAKHNLLILPLRNGMIVSSQGRAMDARHICPKISLKIRGVDFSTSLMVLESKGIDVILGENWLSKHK